MTTPEEWITERVRALRAKVADGWDPNEPGTADDLDELRARLDAAIEGGYDFAAEGTSCGCYTRSEHERLGHEARLTILANSNTSRGKFAAAAVHAALAHYGIAHGAVIVLGSKPSAITDECDLIVRDAGLTEVEPGTATAGIRRWDRTISPD